MIYYSTFWILINRYEFVRKQMFTHDKDDGEIRIILPVDTYIIIYK